MPTYTQRLLGNVHFSPPRVQAVSPYLTLASFEQGDVICQKGCSIQAWSCIISGHVAACVPLTKGFPLPVHLYGENEWFGEVSMLSKQPSLFQYTCMTPVELIVMDKRYFDTAVSDEPNFARYLASLTAWRAQQHSEMLMLMRLGSSPLRVVMGLALYAEAAGNLPPDQMVEDQARAVDLPIGQHQIAALCGVSRTLFSEYIQHLARAGWLTLRYGGIQIQSVDTWRIFARRQRDKQWVQSRPSIAALLLDMASAQAERGPRKFPNLMSRSAQGM